MTLNLPTVGLIISLYQKAVDRAEHMKNNITQAYHEHDVLKISSLTSSKAILLILDKLFLLTLE